MTDDDRASPTGRRPIVGDSIGQDAAKPAPGPYTAVERGKAGGHGITNLYVVDSKGRTIAAIWGKPGEREATAALFVEASRKAVWS